MKLGRKEITLLSVAGVLILALLYYLLVVAPALGKEKSLEKKIRRKEADLKEMMALKAKWDGLRQSQAEAEKILKRRGGKFTLLSFLEGVSRQVGISDKIQYMKPLSYPEPSGPLRQEGMEVSLEGIDISQLVNYLYKIEYSKNLLSIPRIKIQRRKGKGGTSSLKVTLQVSTYIRGPDVKRG